MFTAVLTSVIHWTLNTASWIQSTPSHPTLFKIHFNTVVLRLPPCSECSLYSSGNFPRRLKFKSKIRIHGPSHQGGHRNPATSSQHQQGWRLDIEQILDAPATVPETKKRASSAHIWWLSTGNRDSSLIDSPQARTNRTTYLARLPWLARSRISFSIFIHLTSTQFFIPDRPWRWDRHWVPKHRLLNFRRRGNSQKNTNYFIIRNLTRFTVTWKSNLFAKFIFINHINIVSTVQWRKFCSAWYYILSFLRYIFFFLPTETSVVLYLEIKLIPPICFHLSFAQRHSPQTIHKQKSDKNQ